MRANIEHVVEFGGCICFRIPCRAAIFHPRHAAGFICPGFNHHALPDVEIAGIYSRTREQAEKLAAPYGARVCDSVSDLYAKTGADLVVVTVVELSMAEVAAECFAHSWVVLLEKPAGYDLADATRIRDAAARARSAAFVAFNRRAYSSTRQAVELLGGHSSQRVVKVIDQQDQQAAMLVNSQPELVARNFMFANSIHLIDLESRSGAGAGSSRRWRWGRWRSRWARGSSSTG